LAWFGPSSKWVTYIVGTGIMSDGDRVHDGLGCYVCGLKRVKNKKKPFLGPSQPSAITAKAVYTSGGK
jgi:hypothetical protein